MPITQCSYLALFDEISDLAETGSATPAGQVERLAERLKGELDFHFGIGNWHSRGLVNLVSNALEDDPAEVPLYVIVKMQVLMRQLGLSRAAERSSIFRDPLSLPAQRTH